MEQYSHDEKIKWSNANPAKRLSAAIVMMRENQVLVVKPHYKNHWVFPGGVVEEDESPRLAAIRETNEEVGIDCIDRSLEFLGCVYIPSRGRLLDRMQLFFMAPFLKEDIKLQKEEIASVRWIDVSEISEYTGHRKAYHTVQKWLLEGKTGQYADLSD